MHNTDMINVSHAKILMIKPMQGSIYGGGGGGGASPQFHQLPPKTISEKLNSLISFWGPCRMHQTSNNYCTSTDTASILCVFITFFQEEAGAMNNLTYVL